MLETLLPSPTTRPEQVHRSFKSARDVHVVMEVYEKSGEESTVWEDQEVLPDDQTRYRALAARLSFLAVDRPYLLYAAKECSRKTSKPRNNDWEALKRICRYLIGCARIVHSYRWQDEPSSLTVYSDSDWARCKESMKSTSGACFLHGEHLIKAYSKTQANIAQPSAEAEYYSMVEAASEGLGLEAMTEDYKRPLSPWMYVDATAA